MGEKDEHNREKEEHNQTKGEFSREKEEHSKTREAHEGTKAELSESQKAHEGTKAELSETQNKVKSGEDELSELAACKIPSVCQLDLMEEANKRLVQVPTTDAKMPALAKSRHEDATLQMYWDPLSDDIEERGTGAQCDRRDIESGRMIFRTSQPRAPVAS